MNSSPAQPTVNADLPLRSPGEVMRLTRMGSAFPTRLSFMPTLLRRMRRENWSFHIQRWNMDDNGFGTGVLSVSTPERTYSLVAFSQDLDPAMRTDRVIAEAWDSTFNLFDGVTGEDDLQRLSGNTPLQEAGRFRASELVLARANKSVRLFGHVVDHLARGQQPDVSQLAGVGYLMRTTAVYGNGKFGCADRRLIAERPECRGAFQVEMLAVYLIRWYTLLLVNHVAAAKGGDQAVALDPDIARFLGIGNATGLGMAPFIGHHPTLIHQWVAARETGLARIMSVSEAGRSEQQFLLDLLDRFEQHQVDWVTDDPQQNRRLDRLRQDLPVLRRMIDALDLGGSPWRKLHDLVVAELGLEAQELLVSLLFEIHGNLVDELADTLHHHEQTTLDVCMPVNDLVQRLHTDFGWALSMDFSDPESNRRFWYYSEDKIEPRLGDRFEEAGAALEMPLAIARDACCLADVLGEFDDDEPVATVISRYPQLRRVIKRVQFARQYPYAEVQDNLVNHDVRPIDLLRFKLAFFGATRFDPKSDLWTRITMYQGAPLPDELGQPGLDHWLYAVRPQQT